ncbi:MAG: efflux RND transporter periplasmic adaptor subunit [Candidatus Eisenbacteria bacterium]|nr:efflux RND transporter periplasmic adaptor subunit [Candidatus Eisenbacteria bacterium]
MRTRNLLLWLLPLGIVGLAALRPDLRNRAMALLPRSERQPAVAHAEETEADPQESARMVALPVRGRVVERGPFRLLVTGAGRVEALRRASLSPRVGERVTAIGAREGSAVRRGAELVTLDRRPFEIALREAEAQRARAQIEYQAALLGQPEATDETKQLLRHRSGLSSADEAVTRAQLDLEGAIITAPFDGWVARLDANVGERVAPNQVLTEVIDVSRLRIPAEVLEDDFAALELGAPAAVRIPALGEARFQGTVDALNPVIDPGRSTGTAYIVLENPGNRIRPGMYAEVEIGGTELGDRLVVPRSAVLERDRRLLAFRARKGRAEWSYVEIGLSTEREIEILSGIDPGDTVLVEGHMTLAHGAPIQVALTP